MADAAPVDAINITSLNYGVDLKHPFSTNHISILLSINQSINDFNGIAADMRD